MIPAIDANNNVDITDSSFSKANVQASYFKGNLIGSTATLNSIFLNGGYDVFSYITNAYNQANATNSYATSGYAQANAANNLATSAYAYANTLGTNITIIQGVDLTQNTNITATNNFAQGAYNQANATNSYATSGYAQANAATNSASAAYLQANSAFIQANAAFARANNSLNATTGGTVTGDLTVTGNLTISGTQTYVNTATVQTTDSLIELAANNTVGDAVDIGFYGLYNNGSAVVYSGLVRQAGTNNFLLFKGLTVDPTSNTLPAGSATAQNCYSNGNVDTDGGGIFGVGAGTNAGFTIASNCYSSGIITTSNRGIYATGTLYDGCTATSCQVAFDTFNHVNSVWTNIINITC